MIQNFRDLDIWKKSRLLLLVIYDSMKFKHQETTDTSNYEIKKHIIALISALYRAFTSQDYKDIQQYSNQALVSICYLESIFKTTRTKITLNQNIHSLVLTLTQEIKTGIYLLRGNSFFNNQFCPRIKTKQQKVIFC